MLGLLGLVAGGKRTPHAATSHATRQRSPAATLGQVQVLALHPQRQAGNPPRPLPPTHHLLPEGPVAKVLDVELAQLVGPRKALQPRAVGGAVLHLVALGCGRVRGARPAHWGTAGIESLNERAGKKKTALAPAVTGDRSRLS